MLADASGDPLGTAPTLPPIGLACAMSGPRAPPIGQTPPSAGSRSRSLCRPVVCHPSPAPSVAPRMARRLPPIPRSLRSTAHGPSPASLHTPPLTSYSNARPQATTQAALFRTGPHKEPRPRPTGIGDEAGASYVRGRGSAYSLTPPAVRPETMYFCRYWNSRITGTAAITEPAAKMPHGAVRASAAHMYMPTARVN